VVSYRVWYTGNVFKKTDVVESPVKNPRRHGSRTVKREYLLRAYGNDILFVGGMDCDFLVHLANVPVVLFTATDNF